MYIFTAGRYEFGNKGVDIFIESLARLNHKLKSESPDKTVIQNSIHFCKVEINPYSYMSTKHLDVPSDKVTFLSQLTPFEATVLQTISSTLSCRVYSI